jgi:hypothetical protein
VVGSSLTSIPTSVNNSFKLKKECFIDFEEIFYKCQNLILSLSFTEESYLIVRRSF